MSVIIIKIIGIFNMVLIGYLACRVKWLTVDNLSALSKPVLNVAVPCVIISSMCKQSPDSETCFGDITDHVCGRTYIGG